MIRLKPVILMPLYKMQRGAYKYWNGPTLDKPSAWLIDNLVVTYLPGLRSVERDNSGVKLPAVFKSYKRGTNQVLWHRRRAHVLGLFIVIVRKRDPY